jgi:hypothetical protein
MAQVRRHVMLRQSLVRRIQTAIPDSVISGRVNRRLLPGRTGGRAARTARVSKTCAAAIDAALGAVAPAKGTTIVLTRGNAIRWLNNPVNSVEVSPAEVRGLRLSRPPRGPSAPGWCQ